MGSKKKGKLTVIDTVEERPPHGATAKEIDLYARLRAFKNRNAELEQALGLRALGNEGQTLVIRVTSRMLEMLTWLTQTGLYGATSEGTADQLLQQALREQRTMELADSERWRTHWRTRSLKRRSSRPRRRPHRNPNGKLRR